MHLILATTVGFGVLTATGAMSAQTTGMPIPGACDTPVRERTSEVGCYLLATLSLGTLPQGPVFWHLYSHATRAAAEAARGSRGTVGNRSAGSGSLRSRSKTGVPLAVSGLQ